MLVTEMSKVSTRFWGLSLLVILLFSIPIAFPNNVDLPVKDVTLRRPNLINPNVVTNSYTVHHIISSGRQYSSMCSDGSCHQPIMNRYAVIETRAWSGTVYIRADGSVDPATAPISTDDNITYNLTDDIVSSGYGIVVERSNIVINGNGYSVCGSQTDSGVVISNIQNVTITNIRILNFSKGIYVKYSENCAISDSWMINNSHGIDLENSNTSILSRNVITGGSVGVWLWITCCNVISNNEIRNSGSGVTLAFTQNNTVKDNCVYSNSNHGVYIVKSFGGDRVIGNNISGNSWCGADIFDSTNVSIEENYIASNNWDGVFVESSDNCTINNNTIIENQQDGVNLYGGSSNIKISSNDIRSNMENGILLEGTSNNIIVGNNIISNDGHGVWLHIPSNNNNISYNNISMNGGDGIHIFHSSNNIIQHNNISSNEFDGISLLDHSDNNMVGWNNIEWNNDIGVSLNISNNNTLNANNIASNNNGSILLNNSLDNKIYFNNILGTTSIYNTTSILDNGTHGNYWGIGGRDKNRDWIIDDPYVIDTNKDNKPLLYPIEAFIERDKDYDQDGLTNGEEHTYGTNPYNIDSDEDELTDLQELRIYLTDPLLNDTDSDILPDAWEITYGTNPLYDDSSEDYDSDGLTNLDEYLYGTDPKRADTDGDGMPDGWEITHGLDPTDSNDAQADSDGDGLSNIKEYWFGTDPLDADSDDDGYDDGVEAKYGTDPLDPNDYPVSAVATTTIVVSTTVTSISTETGLGTTTVYLEKPESWLFLSLVSMIIAIMSLAVLLVFARRKQRLAD